MGMDCIECLLPSKCDMGVDCIDLVNECFVREIQESLYLELSIIILRDVFISNRFKPTMSLTAIYVCAVALELAIVKSMAIAVGDRLLTYHDPSPLNRLSWIHADVSRPLREITIWKKITSHRKDAVFIPVVS